MSRSRNRLGTVLEGIPAADTDTVALGPDDSGEGEDESSGAVSKAQKPHAHLRPRELIPGTRYRLVRWLGDGGMGTVFEAVNEDLDRRVALKVLRDAFSPKIVDMFRREARTLGRLGSRFVVDVYDLVELPDGRLMISMELLRGENVRDVLSRGGPLPLERLLPIGRQICKGLAAAHRAGVVHRDVKPENISLEVFEGRVDAVKLLDFGVAQVGDSESRAGTPSYLAPEVISGLGGGLGIDLYALGCTLYELATGRRPFVKDNLSDVVMGHLSEVPDPPSLHLDCPASFDAVVLRCLKKDPDDRYPSAAAVEAALCEVQIDQGIHTAWDDLALPDVEPDQLARLERRMPQRRQQSRRWLPWAVASGLLVAAAGIGAGYALRDDSMDAARLDEVDDLVAGARTAAARAFFVYPPPERPDTPTALAFVLDLESLEGRASDAGREQASELRREFADTLERLGDEYWEADGGKPFALDYYAEALMFDPSRQVARRRASMTPGELRLLRSKAESGSFTPDELDQVEPLIVLADISDEERAQRMASIEQKVPEARSQKLRRVARTRRAARGAEAQPPDAAPSGPVPESGDVPELSGASLPDVGSSEAVGEGDGSEGAEPDPKLARERTAKADAAHRRGDSAAAERLYAQALGADRRHAAAHRGLGLVAFDRGEYAQAARRLRRAVQMAPRNAAYRIELGDALYKSFDYDGARAQYLRAEELGSSKAGGRLAKVDEKR